MHMSDSKIIAIASHSCHTRVYIVYTAGGLATFLHADYVGSILPQNVKYRAFADAGFVCIIHSYMYWTLIVNRRQQAEQY